MTRGEQIPSRGEVVLYRADDGGSVVQLRAAGGTVWLTQAQMAELYGTSVQRAAVGAAAVRQDVVRCVPTSPPTAS